MNPKTLELAIEGVRLALGLVAELQAQHGMSDEQLLAAAEAKDAATRSAIAAHIAAVKAEAGS